MIKITNIVEPSSEQILFAIQGMRHAKNSWSNSDRYVDCFGGLYLGDNDKKLMINLRNAGSDHRKFMRQLPISMRITAPLYWWKEFDTYKVGTVSTSCSTMHKIADKEFTLEDFSCEHLRDVTISHDIEMTGEKFERIKEEGNIETAVALCDVKPIDILQITIDALNTYRSLYLETKNKTWWWQMIQLLPSSYNQTRNITMNYENALSMYRARKSHKLDEWRTFCSHLEILRYGFLIVDGDSDDNSYETCTATD